MLEQVMSFWKTKSEKGVLLVSMALLLPVLFAFTGIAFDLGRLYVEKGRMQHMTDAAVLAGLSEIKQYQYYKKGSGRLVMTIPIGALPYMVEDDVRSLRDNANTAAEKYLVLDSGPNDFSFENGNAKSELYSLRNSDTDATSSTFYYEVIAEKTFPLTFGRIVYGKDIIVRAGSVCVFHLIDPESIYTYAYALENWSRLSKEELLKIDSARRLKVDREAFTNLANIFMGKSATFLNQTIGTDKPGNQVLFGHYKETENPDGSFTVSYKPYQSTVPGKTADTKLMDWLQGNENGVGDYDSTKRYLFSDYAISHEDGFKITITVKNNTVTAMRVTVNPGDAANGSGALEVKLP